MQLNFHCLFEQSGTFKNVFNEFGHNAWDYDILNDYGETDFKKEMIKEIPTHYNTKDNSGVEQTIFTNMQSNKDFIFAFFPCTYFTEQQEINFRVQMGGIKKEIQENDNKFLQKHIDWVLKATKERAYFFELWIKFCFICEQLGKPTIIENPANTSKRSYLQLYSPYRPSFYEKDRSVFGDDFVKPTNFFAINFEMKEEFMMFYDKNYNTRKIRDTPSKAISTGGRSEITPRYARNFYKRFIEKYVENLKELEGK